MRAVVVGVLCCLALGALAHDHDEAFTIFIDLGDFHVTQADNHEFLHESAIGEHDNVVLHLSEAEMKHFMDKHNTHECEHPQEIHEVVSFIQEAMYEAPSAPNFIDSSIDNAINSNYAQSNVWDQYMRGFGSPAARSPMFPQFGGMPGMQPFGFPQQAHPQQAQPAAAPAAAAPATRAAPAVPVAAPAAAPVDAAEGEEDAVKRFREAYRAYKHFNLALEGLGDLAGPAASAGVQKTPSIFDSLMDDQDKNVLSMFSNHRSNPDAAAVVVPDVVPDVVAPAAAADQSSLMDSLFGTNTANAANSDFDKAISQIVDDAYNNAVSAYTDPALAAATDGAVDAITAPAVDDQPQKKEHHHHHHHHHHRQEEEEAAAAAPEAQGEVKQREEEEQHKQEVTEAANGLSEQEKGELLALADKVDPSVKSMIASAIASKAQGGKAEEAAAPAAPATSGTEVSLKEDLVKQVKEEVREEVKEEVKEEMQKEEQAKEEKAKEEQAKVSGASRPAPPVMTSHIEKAPKFSEFVPGSVYNKSPVPFSETPQLTTKHVPKRILIPRMEEPGPVIGGSSRPVHIQLPPMDDAPRASNTRPVAPSNAQMQLGSAITSAAETAGSQAQASVKPSTLAQANDEALSAPEVVIF